MPPWMWLGPSLIGSWCSSKPWRHKPFLTLPAIRPNSATSSNYYTGGTNNSSEVTIAPGAIVINSSGNPEEDADALLDRLEEKIMEQADKSLS